MKKPDPGQGFALRLDEGAKRFACNSPISPPLLADSLSHVQLQDRCTQQSTCCGRRDVVRKADGVLSRVRSRGTIFILTKPRPRLQDWWPYCLRTGPSITCLLASLRSSHQFYVVVTSLCLLRLFVLVYTSVYRTLRLPVGVSTACSNTRRHQTV